MAVQQVNAKAVEDNEPVIVDINDTSLAQGEEHEIDVKEDWQAKAAPPPAGRYALKLFIDDDKVEQGTKQGFALNDPNGKFYKKQIVCKIQDSTGAWQDSIVFYGVSTGVPRGKTLSSAAGLLSMMKVKLPPKMTDLALMKYFVKALKQVGDSITMVADCDWSVWDRNSGKGDFGEALLVGMKNFPKKDGKPYHVVYNKKGEEFVAKLKIIKWVGKLGDVPLGVSAPKPVAAAPAKQVAKPPVVEVVEEVAIDTGMVTMGEDGEVVLDI